MQRKICPICDHVMKYAHYCHFCKQWVSNPNIINATYYLNERHPAHEMDCEYHAPSFGNPNQNSSAVRQPGPGQAKQIRRQTPASRNRAGSMAASNTWQNRNRTMEKNAAEGAFSSMVKRILTVIGLIWIVLILLSCFLPFLFIFL